MIVSDQGREFNNDDIAKQLGIRRRLTTPYHPQVRVYTAIQWTSVNCTFQASKCGLCVSNSIIFCRQTDLMSGLTKHCRPCLSSLLPERRNSGVGTLTHVFAYNTSRHDSSKYTPLFLMFGCRATLAVDIDFLNDSASERCVNYHDLPDPYISTLMSERQGFLEQAKQNIAESQKKQKVLHLYLYKSVLSTTTIHVCM